MWAEETNRKGGGRGVGCDQWCPSMDFFLKKSDFFFSFFFPVKIFSSFSYVYNINEKSCTLSKSKGKHPSERSRRAIEDDAEDDDDDGGGATAAEAAPGGKKEVPPPTPLSPLPLLLLPLLLFFFALPPRGKSTPPLRLILLLCPAHDGADRGVKLWRVDFLFFGVFLLLVLVLRRRKKSEKEKNTVKNKKLLPLIS